MLCTLFSKSRYFDPLEHSARCTFSFWIADRQMKASKCSWTAYLWEAANSSSSLELQTMIHSSSLFVTSTREIIWYSTVMHVSSLKICQTSEPNKHNHLVSIPFNQRMRNEKDWHFLFNFQLYKDFTISGLLTASKRHALHLLTTLIHSPAQTATSWINKMNIFNNRKRNTS